MRKLAPVLTLIVLSGCAATNPNVSGEWDCPAQQGRACTTIEKADNLSSSSRFLPAVSVSALKPITSSTSNVPDFPFWKSDVKKTASSLSKNLPDFPFVPPQIRSTELLGRVWFYPFVDNSDNYHEGGFIHVILRPSGWQTDPAHLFPKEDTGQ